MTALGPLPLPVRDTDNAARQPFHGDASFVIEVGNDRSEGAFRFQISPADLTQVPTGKRAVIEHMSFRCELPPGQRVSEVRLVTTVAGFQLAQFLVPTAQGQLPTSSTTLGTPVVAVFVGSQPIREYADSGTEMRLVIKRDSTSGRAGCSALIAGHFVTLP